MKQVRSVVLVLAGSLIAASVAAQTMPTIDTEDADLGSMAVGLGRLHSTVAIDVRNGDFVRGDYDDDAADLDRLPFHVQFGLGYELHHDAENRPDAWIVLRSSNGLHRPSVDERASPRSWYESNNLVSLVVAPAPAWRAGLVYTIKTSPNGVSGTTHEASATFSYGTDRGLGALNPSFVATVRTRGNNGLFTQAGVEPEFTLAARDHAPKLSIPVKVGVGWGGFYRENTGEVAFGSVGLAYSHPFQLGATKWRFRAETLALVRDNTLRRLGGPGSETGTMVPLATISLAFAY